VIRVQVEDFDLGAELKKMTANNNSIGGLCSFVGLVRDMADNDMISAMTLEHYPGMTERALFEIEKKALARWDLEKTLIIHRYGKMKPGEQIVLVAAASAHRGTAFQACHFLIDWLKTKAPFWKLEDTSIGGKWVDSRVSDDEAASRWNNSD
jgi:molybdopterin synthase catalytic subunit